MKSTGQIFIGTSGWSYKHWKAIYYPSDIKARDWLSFYTTDFGVTEINSSFYLLPKPTTVEAWSEAVSGNFKFCPKMSRFLSHMKKLNEPHEPMERFFNAFSSLKRKLGPVLIQLPAKLAFHPAKISAFYELCSGPYKKYNFAIEVRHESWMSKESIQLMQKHNIAFVIAQSGIGLPYGELVTAKHIYVRFHGPRELYASGYSDEELTHFAKLFKQWSKKGHDVWAFFNNDIHGFAIRDAKKLKQLLGDK